MDLRLAKSLLNILIAAIKNRRHEIIPAVKGGQTVYLLGYTDEDNVFVPVAEMISDRDWTEKYQPHRGR